MARPPCVDGDSIADGAGGWGTDVASGKWGGLVIIRFGLRVVNFVIELSHPK